eukprot:4657790-Prymnesium_polylepis.1
MNYGEFPLTVSPPPTHIVLQGVLVYLRDKLLILTALACAYPEATVLLLLGKHVVSDCEAETHRIRKVFKTLLRNVEVDCHLIFTSSAAVRIVPVKGMAPSKLLRERCLIGHSDASVRDHADARGLCY